MPYIIRNQASEIIALVRDAPFDNAEFLSADHPDVSAFISEDGERGAQRALAESDLNLARVIEDVIQLLVHKNTIMFTELPPAVQLKLINREKLRHSLQESSQNLWDEDEGLI